MTMQLIPGWKRAYRLTSVISAVLLTVLSALQAGVLPLFQFAIPPDVWPWVTASFGTTIVLLRLIAQPGALVDGTATQAQGGLP